MSLQQLAEGMRERYGTVYAARWLNTQHAKQRAHTQQQITSTPKSLLPLKGAREEPFEHESHARATELIESFRVVLGPAYCVMHLLARWSIENATERYPAPHMMTTYWSLEEATGLSERTLRRHLIEDGHPWSEAVRSLIDIRLNYGKMLDGKDESGCDAYRTVITSTVIRFFPRGRQSAKACVKRWGSRDLLADADAGRTRSTRPNVWIEKRRYTRRKSLMSAYSSISKQCDDLNLLMVLIDTTVCSRTAKIISPGKLYADIPKNHVLDVLKTDLQLAVVEAQLRGSSVRRARSRWVDMAAKVLAERHGDQRPLPRHENSSYVTHWDGFTDLWRRSLWTVIKSELYGGTGLGWALLRRMIHLASDAVIEGKDKPIAWAWVQVREELENLRREYGSGVAGEYLGTT
jgi:hypothetical protein